MTTSVANATIVAPLGPNPAPVVELIWGLFRQRALVTTAVFVVLGPRAEHYLEAEVLAPGEALDQLRETVGPQLDPRFHLRPVLDPTCQGAGERVGDDATEADSNAWRAAVWEAGRAAVAAAGDDPVIFALVAGRRRTMTAMETVIAQLLARPQDLVLDVRVSVRAAEGGSGFFFPEQPRQTIATSTTSGGSFEARHVEVTLVDLPVPRLGHLLTDPDLESWETALRAGQRAIDQARPPRLEVDLTAGTVTADGQVLPLKGAKYLWFATLARERASQSGEGWIASSSENGPMRNLAEVVAEQLWSYTIRSGSWNWWMGRDGKFDGPNLRKSHSECRRALRSWCAENAPNWAQWLVPQIRHRGDGEGKTTEQRLPLDPGFIVIRPTSQ